MTKGILTVLLLLISNIFMTFAWYGHLKFQEWGWMKKSVLWSVILIFQVPANRIGFRENGGPFTLFQLKIIQEVVTLVVFTVFAVFFFKNESFKWNHLAAFVCLVLAVYFVFKK